VITELVNVANSWAHVIESSLKFYRGTACMSFTPPATCRPNWCDTQGCRGYEISHPYPSTDFAWISMDDRQKDRHTKSQ